MQVRKNWIIVIVVIGIVLVCAVVWYLQTPSQARAPEEPLTIASGNQEVSALTMIADEKGYFRNHGLNVTIRNYPTGIFAMDELLAGTADLACASEVVGVSTSFNSGDFRIIATTAWRDANALVIRNDRGIVRPYDLKGKKIAFTKGTAAEFFLGRYLALNGMNIRNITVQFLNPADMAGSLDRGDSDAVVIWEPYVYEIMQKLGRNVTAWQVQGGQKTYWVTYARPDFINNKPETIRRYLRALDDAETLVNTNEPEAKAIIQRRLNVTDDYMDNLWRNNRFGLSLEQGLVLSMQDEARWMVEANMTAGRAPPSYLDMVYQDPMREVKPSAVTIIR